MPFQRHFTNNCCHRITRSQSRDEKIQGNGYPDGESIEYKAAEHMAHLVTATFLVREYASTFKEAYHTSTEKTSIDVCIFLLTSGMIRLLRPFNRCHVKG